MLQLAELTHRKGAAMLPAVLADMSPLPFLVVGGAAILAVGGAFLILAVALFGYIKRRKNKPPTPPSDSEMPSQW